LPEWRQQQFGTTANTGVAADDADPDLDGRCNLLEYALGSVPTTSDSGRPADVGSVIDGAGTHLTLTFNRIADPTLTYTVEASARAYARALGLELPACSPAPQENPA
ncbi:MAG TPA: hypothetical protein PKH44_16115, partial [Plasticicumulans sp.]|nr:hypothetical protein [Plasticicumulans sp.]